MSDLSLPVAKFEFRDAARRQESVLAPLERRCLRWLAHRLPVWVGPDHLTLLGFAALFCAGTSYAAAAWWPPALLLSFLLFSINSYLATYTRGTFHLSFWGFSPTEIRILLALGNTVALWKPHVTVFGIYARFFDVGGVVAAVVMAIVLLVSVAQNTAALYR